MPRRYLHLSFRPAALHDPALALPPTHYRLRPSIFDRSTAAPPPAWLAGELARPVVYATLGTVFNRTPGLLEAILAGVRAEAGTLILTVGQTVDPATFGPQPAGVHIERYVPQSLLLPQCDLVVTHG